MFFNFKKDEQSSVQAFRKNCVRTGIRVEVSERALNTLRLVIESRVLDKDVSISENDAIVLLRRGFIRYDGAYYVVTELGLLMVAFAEAAGMITLRAAVRDLKKGEKNTKKEPATAAS